MAVWVGGRRRSCLCRCSSPRRRAPRRSLPARLLDAVVWPMGLFVAVATVRGPARGARRRGGPSRARGARRAPPAEQAALRRGGRGGRRRAAVAGLHPGGARAGGVARGGAWPGGALHGTRLRGGRSARAPGAGARHDPAAGLRGRDHARRRHGWITRRRRRARGRGEGRADALAARRGAVAARVWTAGHLWGGCAGHRPGTPPAEIDGRRESERSRPDCRIQGGNLIVGQPTRRGARTTTTSSARAGTTTDSTRKPARRA